MVPIPRANFVIVLLFFFPLSLVLSQDSSDPDDLTYMKKWAAIGDSYVPTYLLLNFHHNFQTLTQGFVRRS